MSSKLLALPAAMLVLASAAEAGSPAQAALERHDEGVAAYNAHDLDAMMDFYAEDATLHDPLSPVPIEGHGAIRASYEAMLESFPDARVEILSRAAEGDVLIYELRFVATNDGPLATPEGDIPATGQDVDLPMTLVVDLDADGRSAESRRYFDTAAMMAQLGLAD
jgi:steroid delta-isomerase-like uncharacterized protein